MGNALLTRWQQKHPAGIHRFRIIEPNHHHTNTDHVTWFSSLEVLPKEYVPSVVVFAVKPQEFGAILPAYYERFHEQNPLYISIAAGKNLRFFLAQLGDRAQIVRAMPNTPALIGQAVTALCAPPSLAPTMKHIATELMSAIGNVVWVEDEAQMDAVTALSGSGPAYVFLFLESLTNAGIAAGLSEATARELALTTIAGSTALASQSQESLSQLRKNVTSPGGTTEAALSILMEGNRFENLIKEAVLKAVNRAKQL